MTMRFGTPQCIRCTQLGHLSYQCKKPILPPNPPQPPAEEPPKPADTAEHWYFNDYCIYTD